MFLKYTPISADEIREAFIQYYLRAMDKEGEALSIGSRPEIAEDDILKVIEFYPYVIRFIRDEMQTSKVCLAAVRKNGWTLQDVKQQSQEICNAAVKQNPTALQFVEEKYQTAKLCLMAAKKISYTTRYIHNVKLQSKIINHLAISGWKNETKIIQNTKDN